MPRSAPQCLRPTDSLWPHELSELEDAPSQLHIEGSLGRGRRVAIVGTRRASPESVRFAHQLACQFARRGLTVVSGGAVGIDRAAHEGALRVSGRTVAVMAGGLQNLYPREHGPLFREIGAHGALVSEYVEDTPPLPGRFLARNRLIAALSSVVFVIEAPARSGALSTAAHARTLGRPVFAVPFAPWQTHGRGCARLLRAGASPIWSLEEALEALRWGSEKGPLDFGRLKPVARDLLAQRVLDVIGNKRLSPDKIAIRSGLRVREVLRVLGVLELEGALVRTAGGFSSPEKPASRS